MEFTYDFSTDNFWLSLTAEIAYKVIQLIILFFVLYYCTVVFNAISLVHGVIFWFMW